MIPRALLALTFLCLLFPASCWAVDFFFLPDTARGDVGDTVIFSGYIGPSDSMRAFTVYLGYDTTRIRLAMPPTPGDLIAGREGLQFYYYDHTWVNPDRLDIGAAVSAPAMRRRTRCRSLFPEVRRARRQHHAVDIQSGGGADL